MDIQALVNQPFVRIRIIAFVHFCLIVNALLGAYPPAYTFYNILFMVSLMWAIHSRESTDAIQSAAAINFSSFFFDLIIIFSFFYRINGWALIFGGINMVVRPISLILLHKELVDRGGDFVLVSVTTQPNNQRAQRNYQDIDGSRPTPPQSNSQQSNISNLF
ncbi:hypothetical protein PVAND_013188 [Polypedilum vanderplanki]|uniref:Uncharacterized protein n=1 Tax=Polypedilum vanderplanki TaxID=319348 RepID=A0A9J6CPW6_POLVA|nr:hypothetical protein PVAND_013188 [Polypedilum vanderplanki]